MKTLQKHFAQIVMTVKHLKAGVDDLQEKFEVDVRREVQEIVEIQKVMDEVVVTNSDAIQLIKKEIAKTASEGTTNKMGDVNIVEGGDVKNVKKEAEKQKKWNKTIEKNTDAIKKLDEDIRNILHDKTEKESKRKETDDAIIKLKNEIQSIRNSKEETSDGTHDNLVKNKKDIKCRYFNCGFCKYKSKCKFMHPLEVCEMHMEGNQCKDSRCSKRHPKPCKWYKSETGCRRVEACEFSHDTLVCKDDGQNTPNSESKIFKCVSCNDEWKEKTHVVMHKIKDMELYFCLNCDDWVKEKNKVLDKGWSLFNKDGSLSYLV